MKFTYNWLKDFVEINIPPSRLADKLTMAGIEVGSIQEKEGDFVFEIEITSNRPDWLSVIGIAREIAALTGNKIKVSGSQSQKITKAQGPNGRMAKSNHLLEIKIEDKEDCPLYTAKIIRDVKIGPSPDWMRKRLELVDCRSINNAVDITNYILFTYGEPLHAFDLDKLFMCQGVRVPPDQGQIIVRRAKGGEKIVTIDGQEKQLDKDILVIANSCGPVAIAGVMGGKDSEVTVNTRNILLEAAIFNPVVIRQGRQKLGMQSDASYRFERGVDTETVRVSSYLAANQLEELAGGKIILSKDAGGIKAGSRSIRLNTDSAAKVLGVNIPSAKIRSILHGLGFKAVKKGKTGFMVGVPAYRQDVSGEIDLIEEVARIYGYDQVPSTIPAVKPQLNISGNSHKISLIKDILLGLGLNETITYTLIDRGSLKDFALSFPSLIEVQNPQSKEQEVLRPSIIPSLARCVAFNLNQKQNYINIFEVAKIFRGVSAGVPEETLVLGLALCGEKDTLLENGLVKDKMGVLHVKGIIETLFLRLGINGFSFLLDNPQQARLILGGEDMGGILKLNKNILASLDIKNKDVVVAEFFLDKIIPKINLNKKFIPLPIYPGIARDISLLLKSEVQVEDVLKIIKENAVSLLQQVNVVDIYKGKQIPSGFKNLTVSCLYRSDDRTLTEEEITPVHAKVSASLVERLGAQIR